MPRGFKPARGDWRRAEESTAPVVETGVGNVYVGADADTAVDIRRRVRHH